MTMNKMKYPIDCKNDQYTFGYWQGRMLGLLEACIDASTLSVEAAKSAFSEGFADFFPLHGNYMNLNQIKHQDLFVNDDGDEAWKAFSRLLQLWMDLQGETLPGVDETDFVSERHFVNILRLSKLNLEQLRK
ncbi:hypothetical protein COX03_00245 [Candidatus Woesebacteria bacterium CG22_combo_CG10-13_8_21_14_all_39_10]|uniref:Uncharacterized protein n=2 Tax=Candidatus Woeseibacteriota TaxID=1752722 RepID=A0A2H0BK75_9BACT|nr:MAG: hypothetical protein COX03_00245 [Candidatus Woesebacteria bacterium CG22_combo_CG10-13_8_21_14_all_39_10]PIZ49415.1 MAG: hypothetical protein COY29_01920 [Candidatus Woesebacteria bacterium CG_4_10_14_0_2_um_filter_39_14]